jgi:hypothetical protein
MNRVRAGAALLGVACVVWAAVPWRYSGVAPTVTVVAALAVVMSALRLLIGWLPRPENQFLVSAPMRAWTTFHDAMRVPPWEEFTVIAVVWLEALHTSRPWHTAVLGAALIAYLLAAHLAESGSRPAALRTQVRVLLLGAALLAAAAGIGMLPDQAGAAGAMLRVVAALAAILAAALVLPAPP